MSDGQASVPQTAAQNGGDAQGTRSHVCLDCAMPLHTADKNQTPECHCGQFDEVEDDWWDLGNVGPMIAFFIGLTCLVIACGFLP